MTCPELHDHLPTFSRTMSLFSRWKSAPLPSVPSWANAPLAQNILQEGTGATDISDREPVPRNRSLCLARSRNDLRPLSLLRGRISGSRIVLRPHWQPHLTVQRNNASQNAEGRRPSGRRCVRASTVVSLGTRDISLATTPGTTCCLGACLMVFQRRGI